MTEVRVNLPRIAIIDYGMGNLKSVERAFQAAGALVDVVEEPSGVGSADALVFPGQGAIVDTMTRLKASGWDVLIKDWIAKDRPFFGICLGLQALFSHSEEGQTEGLGIFSGKVKRFLFEGSSAIKIPHMGWNEVKFTGVDALQKGLRSPAEYFYFVHSYYVIPDDLRLVWGETEYGRKSFCSAIRIGRLVATQFHPEKSQEAGLQLYQNFVQTL